ncbi:MAG: SGNH/GDSL hydrolase family protein [Cellvibrionaceae bacterium]
MTVTITLPDSRIRREGLPLNQEGVSSWRLPAVAQSEVPLAVAEQSRFGAGARLRFCTNSCSVRLACEARSPAKVQGIDCLVDGLYWRTLAIPRGENIDLILFQGLERQWRTVELYFPAEQEISLSSLTLGEDAQLTTVEPYVDELPLVFYGSSVVQGAGASLSSMSYPAIISRCLNRDIHNWGFYGAGKAEAEVLAHVIARPARAFILDLGKSYGRQSVDVYRAMLEQIRDSHPATPIVVITPIFSAREHFDPRFLLRSQSIRSVMAEAAKDVVNTTVIDGEGLLGVQDWAGLCSDGLHPNELGFTMIAERLSQQLESIL